MKMTTKVKLKEFRYWAFSISTLPVRFLFNCIFILWAYRLTPYPTAFEKFGVRVVDPEDDGTCNYTRKVYVALELLNRHDQEKFEIIRKNFRIIFLKPANSNKVAFYWGFGVCSLNKRKIPESNYTGSLIGWLVYEAFKAKSKGKFRSYLPASEKVRNLCMEEVRRTQQKFNEI
ncbi:MAG TPA: hypothetical protein VGH42_09630 [Verrucomicrobiae bacterium]|jgi:hypothetical protein